MPFFFEELPLLFIGIALQRSQIGCEQGGEGCAPTQGFTPAPRSDFRKDAISNPTDWDEWAFH
jgi:hypothetical protein